MEDLQKTNHGRVVLVQFVDEQRVVNHRWLKGRLALHGVPDQHQFLMTIKIKEHVVGADPIDMLISKFLGRDDFPLDVEHQFVAQGATKMGLFVPTQVEEFGYAVATETSQGSQKVDIWLSGEMDILEIGQSIGRDGQIHGKIRIVLY